MRRIKLTKGYTALIDDADYERVSKHSWNVHICRHTLYAESRINGRKWRLHRFLMSPPADMFVDHINGNGLDNRRVNLRIADRSTNALNVTKRTNNTSGYRGVARHSGGWTAYLKVNGKYVLQKWFKNIRDAVAARKQAESTVAAFV